jgi:hypothetical protein
MMGWNPSTKFTKAGRKNKERLMSKFRVHYTGQVNEIVEADGAILAEMEANERNFECWIAEEIEEKEE